MNEIVEVDGYKFRKQKTGYYVCNQYPLGERLLHRYIWTKHNGVIPKGMVIHHKDINAQNNDISNLQLLTPSEHSDKHFVLLPIGLQKKLSRKFHVSKTGLVDITCKVCGVSFKGFPNRDLYCSRECAQIGRKKYQPLIVRKCAYCGSEFSTPKYKSNKYCSRKCFISSFKGVSAESRIRKAKGLPVTNELMKSAKVVRICECCGEPFLTSPYGCQKTCSHKCGGKIWRQIKRNYGIPVKRKRVHLTCKNCGKEFDGDYIAKFCSPKCRSAWRRKSGIDNVKLTCCICGKTIFRNKFTIPKGQTEFACDGVCTAYLTAIRKRENIIKRRGSEHLLDQRKIAPDWVIDPRVKQKH